MFKGEERTIEIPGFTLKAKEWGTPGGAPVLAIHGWIDNAASFDFLAPLLSEFHIIAIDLPGCGHSSHQPLSHIPNILYDPFYMFQVADNLGWDKFSIIGHSRGGIVGEVMAAGWPERIQALVLLDIAGLYLVGTPEECIEYARTNFQLYLRHPMKPATIFPDLDLAAKDRMKTFPIAYQSALALTERGTNKVEGGYVWAFDRRELLFRSPIKYPHDMAKALVSSIQAPTCFIMATEGYVKIDEKAVTLYPPLVPHHVLHFVPGGHHAHMDNAAAVAPIILDFFKKNLN